MTDAATTSTTATTATTDSNNTTHTSRPYSPPSKLSMDGENTDGGTNDGTMQDIPVTVTSEHPNSNNNDAVEKDGKTDIFGASSNLVNSIVGAGIIGIPFAIDQSGLVAGIVLLIVVSYCTDKSLRMIIELAATVSSNNNNNNDNTNDMDTKNTKDAIQTFEDLMSIPYGAKGKQFILVGMFVMAYGAMVAYLLIIKDSVPTVLGFDGDASFIEREVIMMVTSVLTMVPLSLMHDMSQLAFTSFISVLADFVLILIVITHAPIGETISDNGGFGEVLAEYWINSHLFIGLGVLSTAMACQHSAFLISGSLTNCSKERWATVTGRSLSIAATMSILLGVTGYLGFLNDTKGDILNNFDVKSKTVDAGRALLAVTMLFTYPMESFVARHVIAQVFFRGNLDNTGVDVSTGELVPEVKTTIIPGYYSIGRREKITLCLYLAALLPALIVDDIGPVLSLTGSIGASSIAYIAPGICYIGVHGAEFIAWCTNSIKRNDGATDGVELSNVGTTTNELPLDGDATATISSSTSSSQHEMAMILMNGTKPWWWFPTGMPLWMAIASSGEKGLQEYRNTNGNATLTPTNAKHADFVVSIAFIIFGMFAVVCGVASNIYVEVHKLYE